MDNFAIKLKMQWKVDPFWVEDTLNDVNLLLTIYGKTEIGFLTQKEISQETLLIPICSTVTTVFKKIIPTGLIGFQSINNIKPEVSEIISQEIAKKLKEYEASVISFDITEIQISGDEYLRLIELLKVHRAEDNLQYKLQEKQKMQNIHTECDSNNVQTIFCKKCGKNVPKGMFCIECGNKLII